MLKKHEIASNANVYEREGVVRLLVTIKMIAQRCGLSTAAVSRALNHLPGVSEKRAEHVRQVAAEMGYFPNEAARTLKTSRSRMIGVLYRNEMAHEFFASVLEGIHSEAERNGYELLFFRQFPGMSYLDRARQMQCAGVVVVQGQLYDHDDVMTLVSSSIPTVSLEYEYRNGTMIVSDNVSAMENVVHYLHDEMGHSRIAFIHGESCQVTGERLAGFIRGCRECGIHAPEEYIRQGCFRTPDLAAQRTRELLELPDPPTCILYPDDVSYLGGVAEIRRHGLSVPDDVSCFGFDGISISRAVSPQLTTYFQDGVQMGRRAIQEVISAIEDPRCAIPRTVVVAGHIQEGETVKNLLEEAAK